MRGDIHRLRSDRRAKGHEQKGARYAVVVQATYLPLPTTIVAPTTTSTVGASWWPRIKVEGVATFVLIEQLMAVDASRLGHVIGHVSAHEQDDIDERIREVLGL